MKYIFRLCMFLSVLVLQGTCFANSVSLLNNTNFTLRAVIFSADGTQVGEFVLNPRDAADWSDDYLEYGAEVSDASQVPFTVNWYCMGGSSFGVCTDVGPGTLVAAQSCGGVQECPNSSSIQE